MAERLEWLRNLEEQLDREGVAVPRPGTAERPAVAARGAAIARKDDDKEELDQLLKEYVRS